MKLSSKILFIITFCVPVILLGKLIKFGSLEHGKTMTKNAMFKSNMPQVEKKVLSNGMTVLVRPVHTIPKVSIQLWYNVGSADEADKERGIAHLIEHMIFKGTDKLSESDINTVTHMLSGNCNAFTSYDYTGYLFNLPTHHWKEALPIMADCMQNCAFKPDMLSSEMKAVIQELKMYKDRYLRLLVDELTGSIFADHPYHHPIIGYKQDLWNVCSDDLRKFYKKHYLPNNATLIVVGDVQPEEVFKLAEQQFGKIPANPDYKKEEHYHNQDIQAKTVTLYRDIQQPLVVFTFVVPGIKTKQDHIIELLTWILGKGKSSRLYKKIVDELHLATSLSASSEELFDHGMFFIAFEPTSQENISKIKQIVMQEIRDIIKNGVTDKELESAIKQTEMRLYDLLEDMEHQAYEIGKYYLATGDENYVFNYLQESPEELKKKIKEMLSQYFRLSVLHEGKVLPLPAEEKDAWSALQERSDAEDERILSAHIRETDIEPPSYARTIEVKQPGRFDFPKAQELTLSNGVKVLLYQNKNTPKVDVVLDLPTKYYYDPENKQGLNKFMSAMLTEGTKNYSAAEFASAVESRGMDMSVVPGLIQMSMLNEDLDFGLSMLNEVVQHATFDKKEMEKVRGQMLAKLKKFWDEPRYFAGQLLREQIYKGHPYSKNSLGTQESIENITRQDLIDFYENISPSGARLAVVGDFDSKTIKDQLEKALGLWEGPEYKKIEFPSLDDIKAEVIDFPINRDQVVLNFARLSIDRYHPDFEKLLLFDQIFGGGVLGSMSSRLFQLREQSGLFYTIAGSLIAGSDEQPGMFLVRTIVSLDRLEEAEKAIKGAIDQAAKEISPHEYDEAKNAIINTLVNYFESNQSIARALLFIDRYNLPKDYFDTRATELAKLSIEDVQQAVKSLMDSNQLLTLRIGRMDQLKKRQLTA